jgi:hypothetical protein
VPCHAGRAPVFAVAVELGKSKHGQFRWACDHRLRQAFCDLVDSSHRHNPWAADIYDRARARGASHTHATRILGCAWSQISGASARPRHLQPPPTHHPTTPHRSRRLTQEVSTRQNVCRGTKKKRPRPVPRSCVEWGRVAAGPRQRTFIARKPERGAQATQSNPDFVRNTGCPGASGAVPAGVPTPGE